MGMLMKFTRYWFLAAGLASCLLVCEPAVAADGSGIINAGDTAFLIICTGLVMIMTPGLAFFYGGMVRSKNVLSILMQSLFVMGLISVQWIIFGYTLSFGPDMGGIIGSLRWSGLSGIGLKPSDVYASTVPHMVFALFQLMFAIITAALITGSFAERMKFSAFVLFVILWTTLVYDPLAHWVWGGGFLGKLGSLDFAGGLVVHISSGVSGLVAAVMLGRRRQNALDPVVPHNMPMTVLGAALLWLGWFGFNAGSALAANEIAGLALVTTHTCAAAALLSWVVTEWLDHGKPTVLGAVSGVIAGLVAITPAAGFVSPMAAVAIGLLVSPLCYMAVSRLKVRLGYDDSLDVFGIHGIGGIFGALATGIFASSALNPAGADGLLKGGLQLMQAQIIGVLVSVLYAGFMTYLILKGISVFVPLRVSREDEELGLDIAMHGEQAYVYKDYSGNLTA